MTHRSDILDRALSSRQNRRRAAQAVAAAAGGLLLLKAGTKPTGPLAFAQDDDDDDSSGRGRGRGRGRGGDEDNSGPGNAEDRDEEFQAVEIPAGSIEVRIVGDDAGDFVPGELTVDLGQSVTFVNIHSDEHTATGSGFDTGIIPDEGGTATVVLDTPGVFPYACLIHPEMTGSLSVRDANGVVPQTQTPSQAVPADATTVSIANLAFNPATVTAPTGTTVAWTNDDSVPHTVTSGDGLFDSGIFDPGQTFSHTFDAEGVFDYVCTIHPNMTGTVNVGSGVAAESEQTATAAGETTGPEGVWLLALTPDDEAVLGPQHVLVTFHADGMAEADFAASPGAGAPVNLLTSGHGEWIVQDGVCRVALAALMLDASQRFAGIVTFEGEGQLVASGLTLEGTFDFAIVSSSGQAIGQGSGTFRGESIPLDP